MILYELTTASRLLRTWYNVFRPQTERSLGRIGYGLHRLGQADFLLPPTWVLGVEAFDLALVQAGLSDLVAEMNWSLGGLWNDLDAIKRVLGALHSRRLKAARELRRVTLPERLERSLSELAQIETMEWCVRGSPTAGDHTIPTVPMWVKPTRHELWDAVRQVWATAFLDGTLEWAAQNDASLPHMAVVLQAVNSRLDGTAWSQSPDPATFPGVMIEASSLDLGGNLVHYSVNDEGQVHFRRWKSQQDPTLVSLHKTPIPLTWDDALQVANLVRRVAGEWGKPVQIEFVWSDNGPLLTAVEEVQ